MKTYIYKVRSNIWHITKQHTIPDTRVPTICGAFVWADKIQSTNDREEARPLCTKCRRIANHQQQKESKP